MNHYPVAITALALAAALGAQTVTTYPADYVNVAEGPVNSPNFPFANGVGRALVVYEAFDLNIPVGSTIHRLGFRQDATLTTVDASRSIQLEIRMGYTGNGSANMSGVLDSNYVGTPVTVFNSQLVTLPALRDTNAPLPNGQLWFQLNTPFVYNPGANNLLVEYRIAGNSAGGAAFSYRLDRADFYSPVVNGPAGCLHSGNHTPALTLSPVRCGSNFSASLASGPGNSFGVLLLTIGSPLVPAYSLDPLIPGIAPSCQGQLSLLAPQMLTSVTTASGAASWSFAVPNTRIPYNDMFVAAQVAAFDLFSPGGIVVSNGAQVQIGIQPQSTVVWGAGPPVSTTNGVASVRYCPVALFDYQ